MNSQPTTGVVVDDFGGQVSRSDKRDIPDEAAVLALNVRTSQAGSLETRGGLKELTYDALS